MSLMNPFKKVILVLCLFGAALFISSCTVNKPFSSTNEKGFGGEGSGEGGSGHGGIGGVGGGAR
ncbi:hypothetical protein OQJ18_12865 [Fluoribacter dumoffii]|uniref:Uncharacterized protein n=1 Tax=Fluoribacter dumoffii TaxID=463 RepID=A0A377GE68_9GAMM|nr:hypothetical protein [Fluoribacter dumoffii]KTC91392.1 hypothetical protein Ldum_2460 [Fluoribacter dumoffii NY 23]MCW8387478.1 hypothetical protein [Fluoribacter dumoffii]MCW8417014.1 hypothetical protein [Fluoribacter dumoffii]MCW8455146.1 hypothetical protein [Fluoribacter dumoffii]MCW8460777.1 hypothetical protein [Fluoribacter dumoffii]